jgi:hypothetical protein
MTNLTTSEIKVLDQLALNEFTCANGAEPECHEDVVVWVKEIATAHTVYQPVTGLALSGVMSSLVQKGLIWSDGECAGFTEEGFNVRRTIKAIK